MAQRVASNTVKGQRSGNIGKSSRRQRFHSARIPSGSAKPTKCPIAQVTT